MKRISCFCIVLVCLILVADPAKGQIAAKGTADLTPYNLKEDGPVYLWGEWEFYWNKLLTPQDFQVDQHPAWVTVPGSWHRSGDYSVLGFATYRIHVKLPSESTGLSVYFPIVNSAAKIWINGELRAEIGTVSSQLDLYKPKLGGTIVSVPEDTTDIEIIVQVANYTYFSGGLPRAPQVDYSSAIFARVNRTHGVENFFAGSLIAMFIYQIIFFFIYHRLKPYLWLSLICLGVALRAMIVHGEGSFLLPNLFPYVHWEYWKKIEFGSIYAIVAIFPLYVYHLFIEHAPKKPIYFFVGISSLMFLAVIVTPQYTYGRLLDVAHGGLLLGFIYAVYSIARAWNAGNQDARIILFGVLASFPFILFEILQNSAWLSFDVGFAYLVELGVLVFLLFQIYLLANHYAKSYKKLEAMNVNLEKMVEERTVELSTANSVKDRLLSVMSHDIKSPLNSLRGILQIYNKGMITKEEFDHFAQHIENDLSKTTILVENILYWTASQLKGVQLKKETFDLYPLLEENVNLFQTIAINKKIKLHHNAPKDFIITSDRNIIHLVLRNLIANAIKFSHEGGSINILVNEENGDLTMSIRDDGVGMDEATLETLLASEFATSSSGTNKESGTGLGLKLCKEYLQKAGGKLTIESAKGKGSVFTILLPLN